MIYVDTSALVPVFRELKSDAVIGWIESSGKRLAISERSLVEFASAAATKVRTGQIVASLAQQCFSSSSPFDIKQPSVKSAAHQQQLPHSSVYLTYKVAVGDQLVE